MAIKEMPLGNIFWNEFNRPVIESIRNRSLAGCGYRKYDNVLTNDSEFCAFVIFDYTQKYTYPGNSK
jgi:hypothetical protein